VEGGALEVEGLAGLAGALLAGAEGAEVLSRLCGGQQWRRRLDGGVAAKVNMRTFGTWSLNSSMTTRPAGEPPMEMSKKTWGLDILMKLGVYMVWLRV
jgi:hypothetical protein